jgi:hypothetical protein
LPGTDLVENAAFPLLRSRLGSDHIENMSRGVCLAMVVNTYHIAYSMHVTIVFPGYKDFPCKKLDFLSPTKTPIRIMLNFFAYEDPV